MSAIYCANCFHKNEYQGVRPTVCENCDKPFAKAFEVDKPAKAAHHPRHGWSDQQGDDSVESQEIEEFLNSVSVDIRTDVARTGETTSTGGGVRKELNLPTVKQVATALAGTGKQEVVRREIPDLPSGLQAEGRVVSRSKIKGDYMKDMMAQAMAHQPAISAAPTKQIRSTRRKRSK